MCLFHLLFSVFAMCTIYKIAKSGTSVARKGLLYAAGVVVAQMPQLVTTLIGIFVSIDAIAFLSSCTVPLIGIFNMLVFVYRRRMRTVYGKWVRKPSVYSTRSLKKLQRNA